MRVTRVGSVIVLAIVAVCTGGCARSVPVAQRVLRAPPRSSGAQAQVHAHDAGELRSRTSVLRLAALDLGKAGAAGAPAAPAEAGPKRAAAPIVGSTRVTLESNFLFEAGEDREHGYAGLLRAPFTTALSSRLNLISWPTLPISFVPGYVAGLPSDSGEPPPGSFGDTRGVGDAGYIGMLSPAPRAGFLWGAGAAISFPTATDPVLGTEKWSAGPAAVIGHGFEWGTATVLARQLFSFAGADDRGEVNQLLLRPAVSYQLGDGWFLVSSPTIIANFSADADQRFTVPLGAGVGRITKWGANAFDVTLGVYANVVRPDNAARWQIRLTCGLIFPKKKR